VVVERGAMGAPGVPSANGLPDIAAAKALDWNVELERGLRAIKAGSFSHSFSSFMMSRSLGLMDCDG
jgi:hypothetical protein